MRLLKSTKGKIIAYPMLCFFLLLLIVLGSIPISRMYIPGDLLPVDYSQAIAIDNVHLITMQGNEVKKNRQLLLRDGLIEAIKPAGSPVDDQFRVIDVAGAWLVPGLFDTHVHVYDRKYQVLSLSYGVTTVRNLSGFPMHLRWKQELANDEWLGSNLLTSSPIVNGEEYADPLFHLVIDDEKKARELVGNYKQEGWDYIKIYSGMSKDVYRGVIDEASIQSIPVVGHLPYSIARDNYQLAEHMQTLEHVEEIYQGPLNYELDNVKLEKIASQLKELNATVIPTLMIYDHLTQISADKQAFIDRLPLEYLNSLVKFISKNTDVNFWMNANEKLQSHNEKINVYLGNIVRVLNEHGVDMALGSDYGVMYTIPGLATHKEMAMLYSAGLTPWEILRTATINAARATGVEGSLGTIEPGKTADLVLLKQNPLFDIEVLKTPLAVVKNGQWLNKEDLQLLDESAKNTANPYVSLGHILDFLLNK